MTQNARIKRTYVGITGELTIAPYVMSIKQISDWVNSLNSAYSTINPNRRRLYDLYESIILDTQFISVAGKRRMAVTNKKIEFIQDGKINEEMREKFQTPWFWELIGHSMDALFWSHSLIEFKLEAGVISGVDLIPRQNTNPDLNTIFWDPNVPTDGIAINDPAIDPFLINVQAKQNHRFGLLAALVPYILYKRGSMADWSQFCELFGLPFKEVTYDPYDTNAKKQAEQAMKSMGGAGYVILPNGTSVKIHDTNKTGKMDVFDGLARYCDEQIAKAVLGQTMTTDNGSSKSQAQVHKDVEESVNLNDIIWIEYLLNWQVKKKLERFGHPLSQGRFQFDMTKEIPLDKRIEMDTKLADQIEIDPKYWYETYNIPEPKSGPAKATPNPTPPPATPTGKQGGGRTGKVNLIDEVDNLYLTHSNCCQTDLLLSDLPEDIDADFIQWASQIFGGKTAGVHPGIFKKTGKHLSQAVLKGFENVDYSTQDIVALQALLYNTWQFAGFKTYSQGEQISQLLIGPDGKPRDFSSFMLEAKKIGKIYNVNWLKTEYQHAIIASQAASKWVDIRKTKQALPYLQYDTAGDDKVRPEHAAMDGITLPVDDPFWKSFYPPNGWNCRCTVRKVAGGNVTSKDDINYPSEKAVPKIFRTNIGNDLYVFSPEMPFFNVNEDVRKSISKEAKVKLNQFVYSLPLESQFITLKENGTSKLSQHLLYNSSASDKESVFISANYLYEKGGNVIILPEINETDIEARKIIMPNAYDKKNPDLLYNGELIEVEACNSKRNMTTRILKGLEQAQDVIVVVGKKFNSRRDWNKLLQEGNGKQLIIINHQGEELIKIP
jgi:SPP1 gp7 family putative phage head morphogenesis protein